MSDEANVEVKRFSRGALLTLAAFSRFVRDETDMAALSAELLRVTEETMQPEQVVLWLRPVTGLRSAHNVSEGHSKRAGAGPA